MAKKIDINGLDHFKEKENAMIASEYSSSKTYAVGDYVYHNGTLYKCTTAITTAEAWTSGHWTAAKLADDCSGLMTALTSQVSLKEDTIGVFTRIDNLLNIGRAALVQSSNKIKVKSDANYNNYIVYSVEPNQVYAFTGNTISNQTAYACIFTDADDNGISYLDGTYDMKRIVVPKGASKIYINGNVNVASAINAPALFSFTANSEQYVADSVVDELGEADYISIPYTPSAGSLIYQPPNTANENPSASGKSYFIVDVEPFEKIKVYMPTYNWTQIQILNGINSFVASYSNTDMQDGYEITMPAAAAKLLVNYNTSDTVKVYRQVKSIGQANEIVDNHSYSQKHRYNFGEVKDCYVKFDFKWNTAPEFYTNSEYVPLCSVYGNLMKAVMWARDLQFDSFINRKLLIGGVNANSATFSQIIGTKHNKLFLGNPAFWLKYDGTVSATTAINCVCTSGQIVFEDVTNQTTLATITYNLTDTVDSLIEQINDLTDFSAGFIETAGHTCADLCINKSITFSMVESVTVSDVTTYGAPKINIPYYLNTEWHTCEVLYNSETLKCYVSIDGRTTVCDVDLEHHDGYKYIEIGGTYHNAETPITTKDLVIYYGNFGDAEIIDSFVSPYETVRPQLISNSSPKLLVWEGHGVSVDTDANAPTTDNTDVTTDRLNVVFNTLEAKGYVPITWEDVLAWKLGNANLPKRCYVIMMDDFRFVNYVDYDKRIPFEKYNVKAGLAVITSNSALSDEVEVNGEQYTVEKLIKIVNRAEWYPTSHTKNHTTLTNLLQEDLDDELEDDVLDCNDIDIHSNILIYPHGSYDNRVLQPMQRSAFALGIGVVADTYVCQMTNPFYMPRIEIGQRTALADVLAQIV